MAGLRPAAKLSENEAGDRQKAGKVHGPTGRGPARRALGDIGNLVHPFNARCAVDKENAGLGQAGDQKNAEGPRVMTRRSAAAAGVVIDKKILGQWEHGRRASLKHAKEEEQLAAVPEATQDARISLTESLVVRSQSASPAAKKAAVSPAALDIDADDLADPLAVATYAADIFAYYRRVEPVFRTSPDYMRIQADINDKMRAILIDWLVEVHLKFKLMPETLFLTVNVIDRFLARYPVTRKNLQLVGVTAMLIASKYEEIWAPEVRDFVYISDRAYTKAQILAMEKLVLNTLKFDLTVPTAATFLGRYLKAAGVGGHKALCTYAHYLLELALPDYAMLGFSGSQTAAAAVVVAGNVVGFSEEEEGEAFPAALQHHSGYDLAALEPAVAALEALQARAPSASLVAVFKKYSTAKYLEVATMYGPDAVMAC